MEEIARPQQAVNLGDAERWASAVTGGFLTVFGLARRSPAGVALGLLGGELIRRGVTGHSYIYDALQIRTTETVGGVETARVPHERGILVEKSVTVNKPREEVYRFWRNLENLPRFMAHIESVKMIDGKLSRWVMRTPGNRTVEWDAEIREETENERIVWRSLEGSDVMHAGSVRFQDAPDGRGTEVRIELRYTPPGGLLGALAMRMWGQDPAHQIQEDLRRFRQIMETGEILTTLGQPAGREPSLVRVPASRRKDEVLKASEHSFPASDAPAWRT